MNYPEFKEVITDRISVYFGATADVSVQEVIKNNNLKMDGLVIKSESSNVSPTIYLNYFYDRYTCGAPIEEVEEMIIDTYVQRKLDMDLDLSFSKDYSLVKNRVVYRVINYEKNEDRLGSLVHSRFLDLAVVYFYSIENIAGSDGWVQITNKQLKMWGVDEATIIEDAGINTPRIFPHLYVSMSEMLENMLKVCEADPFDVDDMSTPFHVLSNKDKYYGASTILYPGLLDLIARKFNGDVYVVPSSVHEVLILPADSTSETVINSMIREINRDHLQVEEVLSEHVYIYSKDKRTLNF